jgi:chromosome segregation protein
VKLTELNIVGFKSFAKKTNVVLNDGMTAIVGPNGCGKSNIVDAIRWVMGEQRSSVLRGEKMDNVIFAGSTSAKAVGMAEVSLKIENTQNVLPVDYAEVVITRRLFRSGESQYLLNGNQVRLKDIMDLFMDTGLTGQSYSVIELPQVEKILNGEVEERRKIFEEAAGITRFKQRRKLTFRKLEATEKDLVRVEDIMSEVEKTVRSLKRQVTKAQRYQQFASELKDLETRLATLDYTTILNELEPLETRLDFSINDREEASAALATFDSDYESLRHKLLQVETQLTEKQNVHNQHAREIQKYEERVLVNSERIRSLKEVQERYVTERQGLLERQQELEQSSDDVNYQTREAKKNLETAREDHLVRNGEFQEVRKKFEEKREQVKRTEAELLVIREELSKKQNEGERLRATEENLSQRLDQIKSDLNNFEQRRDQVAENLKAAREEEQTTGAKLGDLRELFSSASKNAADSKSALDRLNKADVQDRNRIEVLENNAEMIRKVLENYQDYPAGVRFLATLKSDNFQSEGAVANVIHVQPEHRTAISSALGEAATYLIVRDANAAFSGINLLQQDRKGIVSFLPFENMQQSDDQRAQIEDLGVVGWGDEIVRTDEKYRSIIRTMLGDTLIVQDLETAKRLHSSLASSRVTIVTLAGEVLGHWGLIRGGSHSKRQSDIVGRQQELEQTTGEIESLRGNTVRRQDQIAQKQIDEREAEDQVADLAEKIKIVEKEFGEQRITLERLVYDEKSIADSIAQNKGEKHGLIDRADTLGQNLKSKDSDAQALLDKRGSLSKSLYELQEEQSLIEKEQLAIGERVQALQVNVAKFQGDFDAAQRESDAVRNQINETKRMVQTRDDENVRAAREIEELSEVNEEYTERIEELQQKVNSLRTQLDELKEVQYETNVKADEQEKKIRSLRSENQNLSESVHSTEMRVSELKMRLQNLSSRILEEYDVALKREPIDESLNVEASRSQVDTLREKLKNVGPVNLLALKEYEQEKERLDFLSTQRADLLKAKDNLTETIEILNNTAREKFLETFEKVQKNFTSVFKTFFDGGRASLVLRDGNDPLEADIDIYAAPGGKKPASLQLLSGGEKSLTAVSLLFAIYLVKPSPFCIFDEVDAPLDDRNVQRFASALQEFAQNTQFIVVTHNKLTMRASDQIFGVTMEEEGVSKVVSVRFEAAKQFAA